MVDRIPPCMACQSFRVERLLAFCIAERRAALAVMTCDLALAANDEKVIAKALPKNINSKELRFPGAPSMVVS